MADKEQNLQIMMNELNRTSKEFGMKINVKKTKVMSIAKDGSKPSLNITVDGEELKEVQEFPYLGSLIQSDMKCTKDMKKRTAMTKEAFSKIKILVTKNLSIKVKKVIIKTLVWSVLLYGSESWTLRKEDMKRLEACEMWIWRRIQKISP